VLLGCRGVKDAAVVGLPHPFWGEEVVAFIEIDQGGAWDELQAHLKDRCRVALQPAAVPSRFIRRDSFPRSVTGKVQKVLLRQELSASSALMGL
jgi:fatty-acyl-CoA synthase/long-chain acyl-CoA synthetase